MSKPPHLQPADLRGLSRLTITATLGVTDLVEALHHTISRRPGILGAPASGRTRGITGLVYRSVRGVTRLVGGTLDLALAPLAALPGARTSSPEREAVLAALNGVLGDHLAETRNPLAIPMRFRHQGRPLELERPALSMAIAQPTGRLLVLAHGLCMNDLQWPRELGWEPRALGYTPLHLHYNSGRHISSNGRELAEAMEVLVERWPVPVEELTVVAHSMGGLVARSACHYAALDGRAWLRHLRQLVFVATPHHGAPLERGGNWVDLILGVSPYTAPFARLGEIRSAGITDLRHGNLLDDDWQGRDRFAHAGDHRPQPVPLPRGVRCFAIAATKGKRPGDLGDRLFGDGLVPISSALGEHPEPARSLRFPASRRWVGYGIGHFEVLGEPAVHEQMRRWLARRSAAKKPSA